MVPAMSAPRLTIVIPTLNAAHTIGGCLAALYAGGDRRLPFEIIVVDGGSSDETLKQAARNHARVVTAPQGRGAQLAAGAQEAKGHWLLFLHGDTVLGDGWGAEIIEFISRETDARRAGYFRFALNDDVAPARLLARLVNWRCRVFALPYGDQGLLIAKPFYETLGGFAALPLMEDVDFIRRLKAASGFRALIPLDIVAVSDAARYRASTYLGRSMRNLFCLGLYFAGVPVRLIQRFYG